MGKTLDLSKNDQQKKDKQFDWLNMRWSSKFKNITGMHKRVLRMNYLWDLPSS